MKSFEKAFYSWVCQIKEVFSGNQSWFAREFPIWFDELPIRALIEFGDIPASHLWLPRGNPNCWLDIKLYPILFPLYPSYITIISPFYHHDIQISRSPGVGSSPYPRAACPSWACPSMMFGKRSRKRSPAKQVRRVFPMGKRAPTKRRKPERKEAKL